MQSAQIRMQTNFKLFKLLSEIMARIATVLATVFIATDAGLVRIPKIYNAVISSNQNLSPSHAIPVVEPVLRTTALGVALPPLIVQQHPVQQRFLTSTAGGATKEVCI